MQTSPGVTSTELSSFQDVDGEYKNIYFGDHQVAPVDLFRRETGD